MSQKNDNRKFRKTVQSSVGALGLLIQPKHESKLPRPYEYELGVSEFRAMVGELKVIVKPLRLQCDLVDVRAITRGARLHLFLLGYRPGLIPAAVSYPGARKLAGDDGLAKGVTRDQWEQMICDTRCALEARLIKISLYAEPWSRSEKFQLRFGAYVKYKEL